MIGLFGGAIVGDRVEGGNGQQVQNVQQCSTQTSYENRPSHYNVVYEYQGTQYNVQMANDPGQYVRLQVTPVGAVNPPPSQGFPPQAQQPQTYYQQAPAQPAYIQQPTSYVQPVYVQPAYIQQVVTAPVVYPAYYPRPHYSPYYSPVGVSLNLGYSRGYGGHNHWR